MKLLPAFASVLVACASASAQVLTFNVNKAIPDGSSLGVADTQSINSGPDSISGIRINLTIKPSTEAAFNGDLYVSLQHDSGFAVLMNRVGVRSGSPFGYSDNGVSVTFSDTALNDIHNYRLVLNSDHTQPLSPEGAPLTGVWAADGRNVNPLSVLDSSARTADLASLIGLDSKGEWTLFVADLAEGGKAVLEKWGIEFITPVPEPSWAALAAGSALAGFALYRRRQMSAPKVSDPAA